MHGKAKALRPAERKAFSNAFEAWRRDNVGRAIFAASRVVEADILEILATKGFSEIRLVHLHLYRNLDLDGTRLTELARRANMAKQGMQEIVDRAEAQGFIERKSDPEDRRAKVVVFSARGQQLLKTLHEAVLEMERRMAECIGAAAVKQITRALLQYVAQRRGE